MDTKDRSEELNAYHKKFALDILAAITDAMRKRKMSLVDIAEDIDKHGRSVENLPSTQSRLESFTGKLANGTLPEDAWDLRLLSDIFASLDTDLSILLKNIKEG